MFYSLDNVVSVPADTLFLQSFDSFHMKATNISIRLIWLFLFLEVGYLQNGLSNCISKICINKSTMYCGFCDVQCLFII